MPPALLGRGSAKCKSLLDRDLPEYCTLKKSVGSKGRGARNLFLASYGNRGDVRLNYWSKNDVDHIL